MPPVTTVITISRQLASGGGEVGKLIADRMNLKYLDREILALAARALNLEEVELSRRQERISSFWERIAGVFCNTTPDTSFIPPAPTSIPDEDVFAAQSEIIKAAAERENCVIVGWGAGFILRDHPGITRVLLHAPPAVRAERYMQAYGIPTRERALETVHRSDRDRRNFLSRMVGKDWMDPRHYHVCLDSSALPVTDLADLVISLVRKRRAPFLEERD